MRIQGREPGVLLGELAAQQHDGAHVLEGDGEAELGDEPGAAQGVLEGEVADAARWRGTTISTTSTMPTRPVMRNVIGQNAISASIVSGEVMCLVVMSSTDQPMTTTAMSVGRPPAHAAPGRRPWRWPSRARRRGRRSRLLQITTEHDVLGEAAGGELADDGADHRAGEGEEAQLLDGRARGRRPHGGPGR